MVASNKLDIIDFLKQAEDFPVIDVRSPSEYFYGHIPQSINIPLFDDKEREAVGIRYKKEGRARAILKGLEMAGPHVSSKLANALMMAKGGRLLVYCWRGGMRSEAMAWLFSLGDIETGILNGGYKSYRNYLLERLSERKKMIVLGGLTGSSKTHILKYLQSKNFQIIDLEGLANHKGSAFGSFGQLPQPSTEHFANLLFEKWNQINNRLPLWVEDESRNIGTVFLPDEFYKNMQETPTIILLMDVKTRLPRLIEEYSNYPREDLKGSIMKINKRLGGNNTREALKAVEENDFAKAIEITLKYYDKAYIYGIKRKRSTNIFYIKTDTDNVETNSEKVLDVSAKIVW
jgi:tRNA 2-selenouridine synthase